MATKRGPMWRLREMLELGLAQMGSKIDANVVADRQRRAPPWRSP